MKMKCPNVLYTALLSVVLIIPFAIRLRFGTEPYPAVLLPSGAETISAAGVQVDCDRTAIYGKSVGRDFWVRLSPWQLLHPIPPQFFFPLAQRSFGLGPSAHRALKLGVITIAPQHKIIQEDVKSAKQWLRARLTECGYDDNILRITQEVVTLRRADGAEIAVSYQDEKLLDLR